MVPAIVGLKCQYEVTITLYHNYFDAGSLPGEVILTPFTQDPPLIRLPTVKLPRTELYMLYSNKNVCGTTVFTVYDVAVYKTFIDLLPGKSFLLSTQGYDRLPYGYKNVTAAAPWRKYYPDNVGYTLTALIQGTSNYSATPVFKNNAPLIFCTAGNFQYDFSASDPDGDSLSYELSGPLKGPPQNLMPQLGVAIAEATYPPYAPLNYYPSFSIQSPFGTNATLDPVTGIFSGVSPTQPGRYALAVTVNKFRNGQLAGKLTKEMYFEFKNCNSPVAQLDSFYRNCKSTTVTFRNYSSGYFQTCAWDFGDPFSSNDTSSLFAPTYTYTQPGVYNVKLYLKAPNCIDSAEATAIVDSGLNANFTVQRSLAVCNEALYDFTNGSTQGINPITNWSWDFGDVSTNIDVSNIPNPSYNYPSDGNKRVRLIISNSIGCADTAIKTINVFRSLLHAPNDTVICYLDTITLNAGTGYPGTYSWFPNYNISSTTTAAPLVSPDVPTTYQVTFTDSTGCVASDAVFVNAKNHVTINITNPDTTICKTDSIKFNVSTDALSVQWQPSSFVNGITLQHATGFPGSSTNYVVNGILGSCSNKDSIYVKVVPYPVVTVSNDTSVCKGAPVYLSASGGAYYSWSPANELSDPNSPTPVAHPFVNSSYRVTVTDTLGCPKPVSKTVTVTTFRGIIAKALGDTLIQFGEPAQLFASGGKYYQWIPPVYLSGSTIADPVAKPVENMKYIVKVSNDNGCVDVDSVEIKVFKDADIYVPTAFTPNGDGKNDVFKIFPVTIQLEYIKIFDRWGHEVFSTTDYTKGWDGTSNGAPLTTNSFVWVAKGKNKKTGAPVTKKGMVTLIR